eukprot:590785-Karenia_brevis.AAC.1
MARWRSLISPVAAEWWDFCGAFCIHMWCSDLAGAPQCVTAACIKTALNGWCTARRFQQSQIQCRFGCGSRQDSIEHYLQCRIVEMLWER